MDTKNEGAGRDSLLTAARVAMWAAPVIGAAAVLLAWKEWLSLSMPDAAMVSGSIGFGASLVAVAMSKRYGA